MNFFYVLRKIIYFSLILLLHGSLNAFGVNKWDVKCIQKNKNICSVNLLEDEKFCQLEKQVISFLRNSWCTEEKARLILELTALTHPQVSVEIGAFTGSSALPILCGLKYAQQGKAFIVDAWSSVESIKGLKKEDPTTMWWGSLDMEGVKKQCIKMIKEWDLFPYCSLIHATSEEASALIESIDFLHLDGNFSEKGSLQDTLLYLPKVKSGGYILLSNLFILIENKPTKTKALWPIFDACEVVCEIENGNVVLFRKL